VVSMRLGVHHVYLLHHPDHVKQVLQDHARAYAKRPSASRVRALFGDSLTVVDGDRWRQRRRLVQPAFLPGQHVQFSAVTTRATEEMLERWRLRAERGEPVEIVSEMRRLTQTIIIRALFGEVPDAETRALGEALDLAVAHVERRMWSPLGWLEVPASGGAAYQRALGAVNAFVTRRLAEARRTSPAAGTLLAALVAAPPVESRDPLSEAELRDECKALLVAGHTTTASALAWTWYVLSRHPAARERVEQECRALPVDHARGGADLHRLDYTRRVIDEVLRLYPPTWLTARTPVEDDAIGGYTIPAGALLLLSPYVTHRDPDFWDEPERFDPDRFTSARVAARPAFAYFPFGGGPRRCVGSGVAAAEMHSIVAQVAQRFRLDLLPGAHVTATAGLTLRPHPAVPMRLHLAPPGSDGSVSRDQ